MALPTSDATPKRREARVSCSVSLRARTAARVDTMTDKEHRTRSNMLAILVEEALAAREAKLTVL